MLQIITHRILVELDDLKREHQLAPGIKLEIAYGDLEKRHAASVTMGTVLAVGPDAYSEQGYKKMEDKPVKVGDRVQFAKFAPAVAYDPDEPSKRLAVIN